MLSVQDQNEYDLSKPIGKCLKWPISSCIFVVIAFQLREKCRYMEFFWSVFSRIWTECWEIVPISPYSVEIKENTGQKNSEYRHFSRSVYFGLSFCSLLTTSLSCTILKVIQRKYCLLYKALLIVFENIFWQYFR